MSTFVRELVLVRRGFADRVELTRRMVARATAGPLLVRGTVFASAVTALLLAYPGETVRSGASGLLLALATLPALRPRGMLVSTVVFTVVFGWVLATTLYAEPVTVWRLAALAGALYLLHTTAALASVLPHVTVVGPGGLYAGLRLSSKLRPIEAEVVVVDPQPHMTYQPFLPEAAAGSISPRHTVVPLRRELKRCHVLSGHVIKIEHGRRTATVQPIVGPPREVSYDHIVVAPGSVSRSLPIPGLREQAVGFKTLGEAIYLRNHVLDRLDVAATTTDPGTRRRALTFVFVGGGYAGIEALAEMEDMARDALRYYPELDPDEMHWVLVEATNRILPEVHPDIGAYSADQPL